MILAGLDQLLPASLEWHSQTALESTNTQKIAPSVERARLGSEALFGSCVSKSTRSKKAVDSDPANVRVRARQEKPTPIRMKSTWILCRRPMLFRPASRINGLAPTS